MTQSDLCPILEECQACTQMKMSVADQQTRKKEWVEGRLCHPVGEFVPSPKALGYRARASFRPNAHGVLGYYRPRSHEHVEVDCCVLLRPELNRILGALPPTPDLQSVELRTGGAGVVLSAWKRGDSRATRKDLMALRCSSLEQLGLIGVALNGQKVWGQIHVELHVGMVEHHLGPKSFYQVNLDINEALVNRVGAWVERLEATQVLDLYAGVGNLSLPIAKRGVPVTLVEREKEATKDAKNTIARQGKEWTVSLMPGNADAYTAGDAFFDVAILDPPRKGAPGVMDQLMLTRPRGVIVVSCNPVALARDVRPALEKGYQIADLVVFDMFPQTEHAEVLCVLTPGN
mgnify:CR=1 FL=1